MVESCKHEELWQKETLVVTKFETVSTGTELSSFKFEISKLLDGTFTDKESVNNNEDGEIKYSWVSACEIVGVTVEDSWNCDKF